jgi:hypothetical protein
MRAWSKCATTDEDRDAGLAYYFENTGYPIWKRTWLETSRGCHRRLIRKVCDQRRIKSIEAHPLEGLLESSFRSAGKPSLPNRRRLAKLESMFALRLVAVVPVNTGGGSMR